MILNMTGQGGGQPLLVTETYDTNGGIIYSINTHKTPIQLQAKTVTPTSSIQTINPDTGYDGMSQVIVNAATGSTINNQDKTVSPSISQQTITADSGYTGLGTVTVNAMPSLTLPTSVATSATSGYTKKATVGRSTSTQYINIGTGYNAAGGYYEISAVANGTEGTPTATKGAVSNHSISVTPSVTNTAGYISGGTKTGTAVTVAASELVSGNKAITSNGTNIDVINYATVSVAVGSDVNNQNKTVTPSETEQLITADSGYTGLGTITVEAISSTYVGSGITSRSSSDLTASGATVTVPAGYYASSASKAIANGSIASASFSLSKTTDRFKVSYSESVTGGYIATTTKTGQYELILQDEIVIPSELEQIITPTSNSYYLNSVTVSAISSTYVGSGITSRSSSDLTASGATVTAPAGYYAEAATKSVTTMSLPTSAAASATSGYTLKATISRSTSDQYINIAPGYNSAGGYYKISAVANGSATAPATISGTSAALTTSTGTLTLTKTVSVTPSVTAGYVSSGTAGNSSVSLTASVTIDPTPTASGATVTIPAGYYTESTTKSVSSGSATGPSNLSGSSATITTGTNTITLTKTGVTTTPTVSAGYVSSATASTATVALTASVTTKAAATITPGTTNQTIASGTYLTGTQTISGDANLVASNIISGKSIFGVSGSVVLQTVYTGSSAPSSSTGSNGDIYIQS